MGKLKVVKTAFFIILFTILSFSVYIGLLVVSVNPIRQVLYLVGIFMPVEVHKKLVEKPFLNYPGVKQVKVESYGDDDEVPEQTVWIFLGEGDELVFDEVAIYRDPFSNVVQSIGEYGLKVCWFNHERRAFLFDNCSVRQFSLFFGYDYSLPNIRKLIDFYPAVREKISAIPDSPDYDYLKKLTREAQMDCLTDITSSVLDNPFCYKCSDGDIFWLYKFPKKNLIRDSYGE